MAMLPRLALLCDHLTRGVTILLMGSMTVSILIGVFFRYVLNAPLAWPPEAARFMMVAITLLASSLAVRRNNHLGITVVVSMLPRVAQVIVFLIGNLLILLFLCVLLVKGFELTVFEGPNQIAPSLQVPMTVAFVSLPVGALLMIVQLFVATARGIEQYRLRQSPFEWVEPMSRDESGAG